MTGSAGREPRRWIAELAYECTYEGKVAVEATDEAQAKERAWEALQEFDDYRRGESGDVRIVVVRPAHGWE